MSKILAKIREDKNKASIGEISNRVYASLEKEMRERLASEMRAEIQEELSVAKSDVATARAESVGFKAELEGMKRTAESANDTIEKLRVSSADLRSSLDQSKAEYRDREGGFEGITSEMRDQIRLYEEASNSNAKDMAKLQGKLESADKAREAFRSQPAPIIVPHKPQPIPEFKLTDLVRRDDDRGIPRIVSATIKPVEAANG